MKHHNFVRVILCLATLCLCAGYKPFQRRSQIENTNPTVGEIGRSVYDPEVYKKFTGLKFHDHVDVEEEDEEEIPRLPSYPWRGGGHEPMPLNDPDYLKAQQKPKIYIMGFRDCKSVMKHFESIDNKAEEERTIDHSKYSSCIPDTLEHEEESKKLSKNSPGNIGFPGVGAVPYVSGDHNSLITNVKKGTLNEFKGKNDKFSYYRGNTGYNARGEKVKSYYKSNNKIHDERDWDNDVKRNGGSGEREVIDFSKSATDFGVEDRFHNLITRIGDNSADGDADDEYGEAEDPEERDLELNAYTCRVCLPCCAYLTEQAAIRAASEKAAGKEGVDGSDCPTEGEGDFVAAECRTCHVRRRLPHLGVVLTCYDCAHQQADTTCRLGLYNSESSQYRVSAKFFVTTENLNDTEVAATQHSSMVDINKRIIPQYEFPIVDGTGRTRYQSTHQSTFFADVDLYPFEMEDEEKEDEEKEDGEERRESGESSESFAEMMETSSAEKEGEKE